MAPTLDANASPPGRSPGPDREPTDIVQRLTIKISLTTCHVQNLARPVYIRKRFADGYKVPLIFHLGTSGFFCLIDLVEYSSYFAKRDPVA